VVLMVTVQNGYPVGNTGPGSILTAYQGRAADNVALASAAASTDADYRGLDLLKNEFNHVQEWADRFIKARNSMSAANLTTSPTGAMSDPEAQKLVRCGQFLAQMFACGSIEEDAACRDDAHSREPPSRIARRWFAITARVVIEPQW
jgi:hypothetical protein